MRFQEHCKSAMLVCCLCSSFYSQSLMLSLWNLAFCFYNRSFLLHHNSKHQSKETFLSYLSEIKMSVLASNGCKCPLACLPYGRTVYFWSPIRDHVFFFFFVCHSFCPKPLSHSIPAPTLSLIDCIDSITNVYKIFLNPSIQKGNKFLC